LRGVPNDFDSTVSESEGLLEPDPYDAMKQQPYVWFHENSFEWDNMVYVLYPYFWGRRGTWKDKIGISENDDLFQRFLQSGGAKVIVPVTPNMERYVTKYIYEPNTNEVNLFAESKALVENPFNDLWIELEETRRKTISRGSGTLSVANGSDWVTINSNPQYEWELTQDDLGRVLIIEGIEFKIIAIDALGKKFQLDQLYSRPNNDKAGYIIKGKLIGAPWRVYVPTGLTYLSDKSIEQLP
jgi:hypothetical protein